MSDRVLKPLHPSDSANDGSPRSRFVDIAEADEVIDAIAKTVAELASQQNELIRQQLIEQLIALRWRVSLGRGDFRSQLSREALTAVRVDFSTATNSTELGLSGILCVRP